MKRYRIGTPGAMGQDPGGEYCDIFPTAKDADPPRVFWCNTHRREAWGADECEDIGGVMMPCRVAELTGIAEIVKGKEFMQTIAHYEGKPVTAEAVTIGGSREMAIKWGDVKFTLSPADWLKVKGDFPGWFTTLIESGRKG